MLAIEPQNATLFKVLKRLYRSFNFKSQLSQTEIVYAHFQDVSMNPRGASRATGSSSSPTPAAAARKMNLNNTW
jgi:hypothetical protein